MGYPIVHVTVSASESADDERLQAILLEIASQNPTVNIYTQSMGVSHSIEGRSISHLQWICDRLRDEHHFAIDVGPFKAILLETICEAVEAEGKYIRQTGGVGNYGHCKLLIEPKRFGEGYVFASTAPDDVLPREYIDSISRGVEQAIQVVVQSGRRLVDLKVTVVDGSYHAEDSNPTAFEVAGALAFQNAIKKACRVFLEPMMAVEIDVSDNLVMVVESQIHEHRGRIEGIEAENGRSEIRAIIPLAELLLPDCRELAEFPSDFFGYEPVFDDGNRSEDGPGVTANKPNSPRSRRGHEAASPDPENE